MGSSPRSRVPSETVGEELDRTLGPARQRPTLAGMLEFMEEATRIVASWPRWKRELMREVDPEPPKFPRRID
jgi:hypothetical protein